MHSRSGLLFRLAWSIARPSNGSRELLFGAQTTSIRRIKPSLFDLPWWPLMADLPARNCVAVNFAIGASYAASARTQANL